MMMMMIAPTWRRLSVMPIRVNRRPPCVTFRDGSGRCACKLRRTSDTPPTPVAD